MLKHTNTCYVFNLQHQFSGALCVLILTLPLAPWINQCSVSFWPLHFTLVFPFGALFLSQTRPPVFIYFTPPKCLLLIPLSLTCIVTKTILTFKFFAKLISSQVHTCNPSTKRTEQETCGERPRLKGEILSASWFCFSLWFIFERAMGPFWCFQWKWKSVPSHVYQWGRVSERSLQAPKSRNFLFNFLFLSFICLPMPQTDKQQQRLSHWWGRNIMAPLTSAFLLEGRELTSSKVVRAKTIQAQKLDGPFTKTSKRALLMTSSSLGTTRPKNKASARVVYCFVSFPNQVPYHLERKAVVLWDTAMID